MEHSPTLGLILMSHESVDRYCLVRIEQGFRIPSHLRTSILLEEKIISKVCPKAYSLLEMIMHATQLQIVLPV